MIWWFLFILQSISAIPICTNHQNSKDIVILGALLPLNSGEDCLEIKLRGIQQLAALENGLNAVNAELSNSGEVKINLQILDTCSNTNKAVKATMKGLVSAEQTCLKPPLFLGYIGPDDIEELVNVQRITSLLNKTHVLPYKIDFKDKSSNIFFVGMDQTSKRANAIYTMLRNLGWENYVAIIEDSPKVSSVLDAVVNSSNGRICPVDKPFILPKTINGYASVYRQMIESQKRSSADGALVIIDKPETLRPLLNILSNSDNNQRPPFVVFLMTVGLKLWEIPNTDTVSIIFMQESTEFKSKNEFKQFFNESLIFNYREQNHKGLANNCSSADPVCLDLMEDELDSSVIPLAYSVHLFANALKIAIDQKCNHESNSRSICPSMKSIQATEWMSYLRSATTILNDVDGPKRIRFQMEILHYVSIYMANVITKQVDLVAKLTNGDRLNFIKNVYLPVSTKLTTGFAGNSPSCLLYKSKLSQFTTLASTADITVSEKESDDWSPIWNFLPNGNKNPNQKNDSYHVFVVLICIGVGFGLFMIITIRMLYKMFKFQTSDTNQSKKKRKSEKKKAKRSSSVSSRKFSRTGSVISIRST
ncbi:uncharacterized protein LOC126902809 [Daktulosphaira vitifoliae]|uniref:uncharacterized protein LOC126902809 n=1 Tax=Daktulosphaira vitifoliae TaxID=58002 RepID=UPI0021AAA351|nr:uncharacterized protein LOC126902809 [Daktulosphaira vitifoliae]